MTETNLKDPAGLLSHAPELAKLARADAAIAAALAKGNPHRVYYALRWARFRGRLKQHAAIADSLLAHRRIFLAPLKGNPTLSTVNGLGATVYGATDKDIDGTYVKTHFLVLVFIPVLPLAQFLVRDGDSGKNSWFFMGRVPFSRPLRIWRFAVGIAVLAGMGLAAYQTFHDSAHHDVHFVNGLPKPVRVVVGDQSIDLHPGNHRALNLPAGPQEVRVLSGAGKELEKDKVVVVPGGNLQIWNILGAAPIVSESVFYTANNVKPPESKPQGYCAKVHLDLPRADYLFVEAPATLQMSKGQNVTSRRRIYLDSGGVATCLPVFLTTKTPLGAAQAEALGRALVTLDEDTPDSLMRAQSMLASAGKQAAVLPLMKDVLSRHDGSVEHHRLYQEVRRRLNQDDGLLAEYQARRAAHPDSADAAYLHARLLSRADVIPDAPALVARFPDHLQINRLAAWAFSHEPDFASLLPVMEKLRSLSKDEWLAKSDLHVAALAALGRNDEARKVATEAYGQLEGGSRFQMAAQVSWLSNAAAGAALVKKDLDPGDLEYWNRRFWLAPDAKKPGADAVASLELAAHYHPAEAVMEAATLTSDQVYEIGPEALILLEGEALRLSNANAIQRIEEGLGGHGVSVPALKTYLTEGRWTSEIDDADLSIVAAAHLARARSAGVAGPERARLRNLAKRFDAVGGFTRRALEAWPVV